MIPSSLSLLRCSALALVLCVTACSGGGGGSGGGSFDDQATLLQVRFPDPTGVGTAPDTEPPADASLIQQVVLEFDGRPNPDQVSRLTVQIRDERNVPVVGRFDVNDRFVTFTPTLPLRQARALADGTWDTGGTGLNPETRYSVRVGNTTWPFVNGIAPELAAYQDSSDPNGISMVFTTTKKLDRFFRGLPKRLPQLVRTEPGDGATDVSPQLYTDPDGLFPPRSPFLMHYDAPVFPGESNLDFLIVDLDDPDHPTGLSLAADVSVIENELEGSVVRVMPSGILPFGHLLTLEAPVPFASLAGKPPEGGVDHEVVASFTTSTAPDTVRDRLEELFATRERQEVDPSLLSLGELPAEWDQLDSNVLEASFAFDGAGELGRFIPAPPPKGENKTIVLDTSLQVFPLFDGSTPDAPPGFEVRGGVFHFSEIIIPKGVYLDVRGSKPLVLTATKNVEFGGRILLDGKRGTSENAFDSGVASIPGGKGGSGGGRGGESHPIFFWPPDQFAQASLVSPPRGGQGFGPGDLERTGGQGGESGIRDDPDKGKYYTDQQMQCQEFAGGNNGDFGAGGCGGSFLTLGRIGRQGNGNVRPDTQGTWILTEKKGNRNWDVLYPGSPGISPSATPTRTTISSASTAS